MQSDTKVSTNLPTLKHGTSQGKLNYFVRGSINVWLTPYFLFGIRHLLSNSNDVIAKDQIPSHGKHDWLMLSCGIFDQYKNASIYIIQLMLKLQ